MRAEPLSSGQLQVFKFRFVPHVGHKPLQSTLHSAFIGRASSTCSRRMSPIASCVPVKNAVRVSSSVSSISSSSSNIIFVALTKEQIERLRNLASRRLQASGATQFQSPSAMPAIRISSPARSAVAVQVRGPTWREFSTAKSIEPGSNAPSNETFWSRSLRSTRY